MTTQFEILDYVIFISYALLILGVGLFMSRDKKGHQKNAEDYF
jgi:SSS family solute:Na+ symporter